MTRDIRILIVEDSEDDCMILLHTLRKGGYDPQYLRVETAAEMISSLDSQRWDLVISDYVLPNFSGLAALNIVRERDEDLPFILLSGRIGEDTAVEAMKLGANDYLIKGMTSRLIPAIERELHEAVIRRDKKLAEYELVKSEQRYRRLVDAVTDYIYQVRLEQGAAASTFHGPGCYAVTGYTSEEYAENPLLWYEMILGDDRKMVSETMAQLREREVPPPLEHRIVRKDGSVRWVMNTIVPKYAPSGELTGYDGLINDITDRKRAEEELLLQSMALNAAANAIVITDDLGRILWINQAFQELTGYSSEEIVGVTLNILKSGLHDSRFYGEMWEAVTNGTVWRGELTNRRRDGSLYIEEQTITPVFDRQGVISNFIAIKQDISQRKLAEKALLQNAEMMMEMEVGKKIQRTLLPDTPPKLAGLEIAGSLVAASHVGGDYYDFFERGTDGIDLVIADVTGHSIGSALIMAEARGILHSLYSTDITASEILSSLGKLLYEDLSRAELFVTVFYARYDARHHTLSFANAGHSPPLLYHPARASFDELDAEGLVLGVNVDFPYEDRQVSILRDDVVVLYTDGITESANPAGEMFGTERLKRVIADNASGTASSLIDAVFGELALFSGNEVFQDDISIVVMKFDS